MGYLTIYIDSHGNLYPGCWVLPPIENLMEKKLKDILVSKEYNHRVKAMFALKCPGCTCNYCLNHQVNNLPSTIKEKIYSKFK